VWIESGKDVANGDAADVILDRSIQQKPLGWVTFEFTFLNHAPINKYLSVRYGGGAGLGIVKASCSTTTSSATARRTRTSSPAASRRSRRSTAERRSTRVHAARRTQTPRAYDLPPVFPVVNAIIGLQVKPMDKMTINIEGGIRTFLFFGTSVSYFF